MEQLWSNDSDTLSKGKRIEIIPYIVASKTKYHIMIVHDCHPIIKWSTFLVVLSPWIIHIWPQRTIIKPTLKYHIFVYHLWRYLWLYLDSKVSYLAPLFSILTLCACALIMVGNLTFNPRYLTYSIVSPQSWPDWQHNVSLSLCHKTSLSCNIFLCFMS